MKKKNTITMQVNFENNIIVKIKTHTGLMCPKELLKKGEGW